RAAGLVAGGAGGGGDSGRGGDGGGQPPVGLVRRRPDARLRSRAADLLPLPAAPRPARRPRGRGAATQPGRLARRGLNLPAGTPPAFPPPTVWDRACAGLASGWPGPDGAARAAV